MDQATPKINPILGNGLAVTHMRHVEGYIDSVIRSVASGFPPWLKYLGCRRCDPVSEYAIATRPKSNRRTFDVARSDIYLMEYTFRLRDEEPIKRYMYLPYVSQAGIIYLAGSRYTISPVLADRVISVGMDYVFVRLLKAKLTFNRKSYQYNAGNRTENVQVIWSKIHNNRARGPAKYKITADCLLVHYLLCKYGFNGVFKHFLGYEPIVGGPEVGKEYDNNPQWVVCRSSNMKPRKLRAPMYRPSTINVAIPRDRYDINTQNMLAGFFYVVDHFPDRVLPEYVNDVRLWQVLLGHLIWSSDVSEGKLYSDVSEHIASLDVYIDNVTAVLLKDIGMACSNVYELFWRIIQKFNDWLMTSDDRVNTMYDKELSILPFVCMDFVSSINQLYFKLIGSKKELTNKDLISLMDQFLRMRLVHNLKKQHGEVSTCSTSGDNMALKITNLLVPQTKSTKSTTATQASIDDPATRLHASLAEVGGYASMPKSSPDGRSRLNLCLTIDPKGLVVRNPKHKQLIDSVQEKIRRQ